MTVFDRHAVSPTAVSANRSLGALAGLALMASIAFLFHRAAPGAPTIIQAGFAGVSGLATLALAFTLDETALPNLTKAVAAAVGLLILCAFVGPEPRLRLASFASAAFGVGLAVWLVRTARKRPSVSWPLAALFAVGLALLSAYAAYLVLVSRDLMTADFMTYRGIAMMVARLGGAGNWPLLLTAGVESVTQDYSWAPGLVPGLLLALTEPTSRAFYTFALLIVVMLALEVLSIAFRQGARFRWKDAVAAAALGAVTLLALLSPVLIDWAPNLSAHDYAETYAGYRKPPEVFLRQLGDWVGIIPALAALAGAAFLWAGSHDKRLLRLTLGGAAIAAALFLRIQTPYIHHLDLIAPAIVAPIAASLMLLFARAPRAALLGVAALSAVTLSPLAAALNPLGLAPIAGLPRAPRADLEELGRLKDWVDERARPDAKVCGLGSSYTFSGQLIGELWQLRPERGPSKPKLSVTMPDVDTVDGPPAAGLKDCAIIIVGDPIQTHLDPTYQQTVIAPSREMLTGQGIGAKFRRTGEGFHLENGVNAVVFERLAPLDDADIAALQARWRAARAALGFDEGRRR